MAPAAARGASQAGDKQQETRLRDSDPSHPVLAILDAPGLRGILMTLATLSARVTPAPETL